MKLNASTKDLKAVIDRLANLPGAVTGSPVTQCVTFEAGMDGVKMTRFSSEARICVTLEAATIQDDEGKFSISHNALTRMVNQLPAKEVTLESDDKNLHFASGKARGKIAVTAEIESEAPEADMESEHIRLPLELFVQGLEYASMAMHNDESSGGFFGICVRMIDEKLAFIATNRRWFHLFFFDYAMPVDCVISAKTVEAILKAVGKQAGACTFAIGENSVSMITPDSDMNFALLSASYPNVSAMLKQDESSIRSKVVVDRKEFLNAVKTTSGISDDDAKFVDITLEEDGMTILATSRKDSESDLKMEVECKASAPERFTTSGSSIISSLSTFSETEEIELILYPQFLFVRESNRVATFALKATA